MTTVELNGWSGWNAWGCLGFQRSVGKGGACAKRRPGEVHVRYETVLEEEGRNGSRASLQVICFNLIYTTTSTCLEWVTTTKMLPMHKTQALRGTPNTNTVQ